ncbi:hypothetical protein, partial [Oligella sp. HMSC05A10]|uniref:hypothetical protein n=1 Tax=Oligella sp. HMSC05A10 TaxID=1581112 RepID=UPI000B2AFD54
KYRTTRLTNTGFTDAVATYLDFYHLPDTTKKQLFNEINYQKIALNWRYHKNLAPTKPNNDLKSLLSKHFYEKGFVYHSILNSESHAAQTKVQSYSFPCAAELLFLNWCRNYLVVGVSATANIKSRLGNYDLHYLNSSLEQDLSAQVVKLSDEHRAALQQQFINSKAHYDKISIQTHWHGLGFDLQREEVKEELLSLFKVDKEQSKTSEDDIDFLIQKVLEMHGEDSALHYLKQYYKIFELWVAYLTQDISAFLLMFSKGYKKERDFICEYCQQLIEIYLPCEAEQRKAQDEIVTIVGADSLDTLELTKSALKKGEKRFVLSTYITLGAGINIQYPIPEGKESKLVKINDFEANTFTDFDGLYIDKPTNLLVNTYKKNIETVNDLVKHIYELEYLKISCLTDNDFKSYLQRAFLSYLGRSNAHTPKTARNIYQNNDYKLHMMQILIQAIGRICRTNMKSPTIHLHMDRALIDVWVDDLGDMSQLPEFIHISQAIANQRKPSNILYNAIATKDLTKVRDAIYLILSKFSRGEADEATIEYWKMIREVCLRHPQLSEISASLYHFFYTNFEQPKSAYFYTQKGDYQQVEILSDYQAGAYCVSEQSARLDKLMSHSGLKAHFEKHGYATKLSASKHWLQPILFNNIYKGGLGEICGAYLWNEYGLPLLHEMPSNQYEIFDFMVTPDIFVDFKHWSKNLKDGKEERAKIFKKMDQINAALVFVINILEENDTLDYHIARSEDGDKQIVEIPNFLFDTLPNTELINSINKKIAEVNYGDKEDDIDE